MWGVELWSSRLNLGLSLISDENKLQGEIPVEDGVVLILECLYRLWQTLLGNTFSGSGRLSNRLAFRWPLIP